MFSAEWDRSKNQLQHEDEAGRAREKGAEGAARTPLASDPQYASEPPHPYQCKLLSSVKSCTHRWQSLAGSASVPDDLRVSSLWLSDLAWPDT